MEYQKRPITRLGRMATHFSMKLMDQSGTGLTHPEIQALRYIARQGGISQAVLTARLGVDKAAVARVLKSLEEKEYIYRETDPEDKRAKRVYPLDKAQSIKDDALSAETLFYRWLLADLSPEEQEALQNTLDALAEKASAQRKLGYPEVIAYVEKERNEVNRS